MHAAQAMGNFNLEIVWTHNVPLRGCCLVPRLLTGILYWPLAIKDKSQSSKSGFFVSFYSKVFFSAKVH